MSESQFEGTLVLERLAEIGKVEEFFDAIDSDNFSEAKVLMETAGIDVPTIKLVLQKMADADGEY